MELGLGTSKKGSQGAARKQGKRRHDQTRNRLETQAGHKQLDARMVTSVLFDPKERKANLVHISPCSPWPGATVLGVKLPGGRFNYKAMIIVL